MPLIVNVRHLEHQALQLEGDLPVAELGLEGIDELIHPDGDLRHELEVSRHERGLLVQGRLHLRLRCECVRCLEPFDWELDLPGWACLLPWEGEDRVVVQHDLVDLTPYLREDIVLALPQHPLCKPDCRGLRTTPLAGWKPASGASPPALASSTWAALNKLKL
jgi:uncharacterized protein